MKYFLIGFIIGFSICLVWAYFITKPKVTHNQNIDTGYTFLRLNSNGHLATFKLIVVDDNPLTIVSKEIDTLPILKRIP
jgi:hypothetical protein